jgi:hypothetical protein
MTDNTITTYNGLLKQRPTSPAPRVGEQRYFSWQERTGKRGNPYTHVKNEQAEYGGQLCEIISSEQTDYKDAHGNLSFNVEFTPLNGRGVQPATAASTEGPNVSPPANPVGNGLDETRRHLMQVANLYNLCVKAVNITVAPNVPEALQTSEWLQAAVSSLFIEATRHQKPGERWTSWADKMPEKPIKL